MAVHGHVSEFDPKKEEWKSYAERLSYYFIANDITTDAKKQAVLLSASGSDTFELIQNLLAPVDPKDKSFDELVTLLENHYKPKPSEIVQRYHFNCRDQKEGENISTYVSELRKLSQHCNYGTSLNDLLRDRLVCGIRNGPLQRKLLAEKELTFKTALEMAQAWETAEASSKDLQKPQNSSVHSLRERDPSRQQKHQQSPAVTCYRCGGQHKAPDCRFKNTKCHTCQKVGHLARVCRTHPHQQKRRKPTSHKTHHVGESKEAAESEEYSLFTVVGKNNKPITAVVTVNDMELTLEVDTGASRSLISEYTYLNLRREGQVPELQSTSAQLQTYTGERLETLGYISAQVKYQDQTDQLDLIVVQGNGPSLLGRDWLGKFQFDWRSLHRIQDKATLEAVLEKHGEVFREELGEVSGFTAKIHVDEDKPPRYYRPRLVPFALREKVEKELTRLVDLNVIKPIQFSEWATPIVPVVKPDGSIRICGDYKLTVNQVAKLDTYPLPRIEDLFASLSGGQTFSKLDLAHAYLQVKLDEESQKYVAVNTQKGLYTYTRLPFGVASAPSIFQRMMESILQGLPHVSIYLDDILVTGKSEEDHLRNLDEVLGRLKAAGLRLKQAKCAFMLPSVEYLGHRISAAGLQPSEEKIRAITKAPAPTDISQLRSFLGVVNYYCKFLPNLSSLLAPLHQLLQHGVKWKWGKPQQNAFQEAKQQLTSKCLLVHFDPGKPLLLSCDASPYGVGAVLSHLVDGEEKPIAFASRTLAPAEKRYSQIDKEGLAIIFGVKKFNQYLLGRKFTIYSDHKPLKHLFKEGRAVPPLASSRIQRWALTLGAYNYTMMYRPGKEHSNADVLSRLPLSESPSTVPPPGDVILLIETLRNSPVTDTHIREWTNRDPKMSRVRDMVKKGWSHTNDPELRPYQRRSQELSVQDGCILIGSRVVIPPAGRERVLELLHEGHIGICRMKSLARGIVWWPNLDEDLQAKVKDCYQCQLHQKSPPLAPLHPWEWPGRPWSRLHIDYAGPVRGKMLLVLIDSHSKWLEVVIVPSANSFHTIEKLRSMFSVHGLPEVIVSDNGSPFTSSEFHEFTQKNGIRHVRTSPYHPASNGQAERAVQVLKEALKKSSSNSMEVQLARFLFKYRITPHTTTGVSPSEMLMGRQLRSHLDLLKPDVCARV